MPCCFNAVDSNDKAQTCQFDMVAEGNLISFNGKHYCQFHLPLMETMSGIVAYSEKDEWRRKRWVNDFNSDVVNYINDQHAMGKVANLTGVVFPGHFSPASGLPTQGEGGQQTLRGIAQPILFNNCLFYGRADFSGVLFAEGSSWDEAIFYGDALFCDALFEGAPSFQDVTFGPKVAFTGEVIARPNLSNAKLRGASLTGSDLRGACLYKTDLRDTDLSHADLRATEGLIPTQLSGTDLTGAKLDAELNYDSALAHIESISKHARNAFLSLLGACLFVWVTLVSITNRALLDGTSALPLPLLSMEVPAIAFFLGAPALLLTLFAYLHLYLQRLWDNISRLPAFFQDGRRLTEAAYPWLLSGLVHRYMPRLKANRPPFTGLQRLVSLLTAWWAVPLTFVGIWVRYAPLKSMEHGAYMACFLFLATILGLWFYRQTGVTLRERGRLTTLAQWRALSAGGAVFAAFIMVQSYLIQTPNLPDWMGQTWISVNTIHTQPTLNGVK